MNQPHKNLNSQVLESAWQRYAEFNLNANLANRHYKATRQLALSLAMLAVILAVFSSDIAIYVPALLSSFFSVLLMVVLIINFVLLALSIRSQSEASAVELRAAAEEIKKEIYLYRTVMQWHDERDQWLSERLTDIQRHVADTLGSELSLKPYTAQLPPVESSDGSDADPGFTRLLPDDYIHFRLEVQLEKYNTLLIEPQRTRNFLQIGLLLTGGLSLLLAASGGTFNAWVAVAVFATAAMISWLEPRQLDASINALNQLIVGLNIIRDRWRSLNADEKTTQEFFRLVIATEKVIWSHYNKHSSEMWRAIDELQGVQNDALSEVLLLPSAICFDDTETAPMNASPPRIEIETTEVLTGELVSVSQNGSLEKTRRQDTALAVVETVKTLETVEAKPLPPAPATGLPHAFVVMPFGRKQGGDGRWLDFDAIYNNLIHPALEAAGFESFRADEEAVSGDILTDMFQELLLADLVIADLSIDNANVFYELGVRHAIRKRGVVHIQSGRSYMPFDIFNVRTIPYHVDKNGRPDPEYLEKDRQTITKITRETWASDIDRVHSPIFNLLDGLPEPDRRALRTPLATGFWREYNEWQERVALAQRQKRIGDVLLLTEEISNPLIKEEAIGEAGKALQGLGRSELALQQYRLGLEINPRNHIFRRQEAFHLNRMGRTDEAIIKLERLLQDHSEDIEAISYLGRIYKQMWMETWEHIDDDAARLQAAYDSSHWLVKSVHTYLEAYRLDQNDYYPGINAVTGSVLMDYLATLNGVNDDPDVVAIRENLPALKGALQFSLESTTARHTSDYWALVSLAELLVSIADDPIKVVRAYRKALTASRKNIYNLKTSLYQLHLLKSLNFRPEFVNTGIDVLQAEINRIKSEDDAEESTPSGDPPHVFVFTGHPVDHPKNLDAERFPATMENEARDKIQAALEKYNAGVNDLAITAGAAAGGDIIFIEACLERGMKVEIHLPFEEGRYIKEAVSFAGDKWIERFYALRNSPDVTIRLQGEHLGLVKMGDNIFARNEKWALYNSLVYGIDHVRLIALWDGQVTGTPGGPDSMVEQVRHMGGQAEHLNTTKFDYWKTSNKMTRVLSTLPEGF